MTLHINSTAMATSVGSLLFAGRQKPAGSAASNGAATLPTYHIATVQRLHAPWANPDSAQPLPQAPFSLKTLSEWLVNQPSQRSLGLTPTAAQPLIQRVLDEQLADLVQQYPNALHQASRIADVIKTSRRIAIAAPFAPTGQATDTLLLASGLASRLKTLWPEKTIDLITPASRTIPTLASGKPYYDAMITLGLPQLSKAHPLITTAADQSHVLVNMDNALTNQVYGTPGLNWINPFCPNRALMIQTLLEQLPKLDQATALLLGQSDLITHQRFTKNTFSPSDHQLFADIVDTGVDTQRYFNLSPVLTMAQLPRLGYALSHLKQHGSVAITQLPPTTAPLTKAEWVNLQERLMDALDIPGTKTLVILQPIQGSPMTYGWAMTKYPKLLPPVKHALFQRGGVTSLTSWSPSEGPSTGPISLRPLGNLKGVGFKTTSNTDTAVQTVLSLLQKPVATGRNKVRSTSGRPAKKRFGSAINGQLYGQSALPSQLLNIIRDPQKKRVLVVAHSQPDGDALGSVLGLGSILGLYGKEVTMGYDGLLPKGLPILPGQDRLVSFDQFKAKHASSIPSKPFDAVFLLDSSGLDRTGQWQPIIEQALTKINIDHHPTPALGFDQSWIDLRAASTTELIALLAQTLDDTETARKKPLLKHPDIQACLYRGMVTDTGSFLYGSTKRTHQLAAKLSSGASRWPKLDPLPQPSGSSGPGKEPRMPHLLEFYQLQGQVLSNAVIDPVNKRIRMTLTQSMIDATKKAITRNHQLAQSGNPDLQAYKDLDLTKLDDALMVQVKGPVSRMASTIRMDDGALPEQLVFFHQIGPDVRISFRYQHAGDMAQWFGGGGHAKAAGAQVPNQSVEAVVADFEKRLVSTPLDDDAPRRQWMTYLIQDSLAIARAHRSA